VPTLLEAGLEVFLFFSLSWASNTLWGSLDLWVFESTSVIGTSMMRSVPRAQRPRTKMSPRSSVLLVWKRRLTAGLTGFPWLISAPQCDWYGFLIRRELRRGRRPWKQGRSACLKSHCAVRLRDPHAYIQAHGKR
jgi:hypothetical protein